MIRFVRPTIALVSFAVFGAAGAAAAPSPPAAAPRAERLTPPAFPGAALQATEVSGVVLDAANLSDGIKFRGRTMVFSWPSKAGFLDYAYDRESAMWSRDGFERVLNSIVGAPGAGRTHIVAHSMGTMLTLESLRMARAGVLGAHMLSAASNGDKSTGTLQPTGCRAFIHYVSC